jgi:asparagine synthase (glutamine-hydrolysing)
VCGIAGWFSDAALNAEAPSRLNAMVEAVAHRGPDGRGHWLGKHAALGHARLAIIDPAGGKQPMQAGEVTITFNGEIYNFRQLRGELASHGYRFTTESDTEVILALYRHGGWRAFSRLRGMYAFALWDDAHQVGYLVRDPLGIKPLFTAQSAAGLLFASEAKGILAQGSVKPALDESSLHLLMNFRYLPGDRTMFRDIRQLPPGGVLEWRPERTNEYELQSQDWPALPPMEALQDSVAAHLTADVEVGAYLSGGIDSAAITALAREGGLRRTFTLPVGDDPHEAANAKASAELLGLDNLQQGVTTDASELLPRLIRHLEVPKVNSYQLASLAALARTEVKVVLSGLGGDELFYGYNAHRLLDHASKVARWMPRRAAQVLGGGAAALTARLSRLPWSEAERAARMLAAEGKWPRVYGLLRNVWDGDSLRCSIYGPRMLEAELPDAFAEIERSWPAQSDPVAAMARYEWRGKMINDLLWQEDRVSMAVGLEVRVPLVDPAVAQAVERLGREELMPRGRLKGYMREMLRDVLPPQIMNRPKSGFQVDAPSFFHGRLLPLAREYLTPDRLQEDGLYNPAFVQTVLSAPPRKGFRWHYFMLYLMLMTELWREEFKPT